jgi:hypothetical protein
MKVSGQLGAPAALPPEGSHWYPLDKGLGGPQNRSGRVGAEKYLLFLPGIERQSSNPSLYRLNYPGSCTLENVKMYVICHKPVINGHS